MSSPHSDLLTLFHAGVDSVKGDQAVCKALQANPLTSNAPVHLLAFGKAADSMVQGAVKALADKPVRGLMITKQAHSTDVVGAMSWMSIIESSHPVPNESSLQAGSAAIEFVQSVPTDAQLLVLVSGGASALLEHLIEGLTLEDVQELNDNLLSGGLPIDEMNRVRKTVSAIKGGKLSGFLPNIPVTQLVISDVPGDKLSDIGSGVLAMPEADDAQHPGDLLSTLPIQLSDNVIACVNAFGVCAPHSQHAVWSQIQSRMVGSSDIAQSAVIRAAHHHPGLLPIIQNQGSLHGDVEAVADAIAQHLINNQQAGLSVWGGETHLVLPAEPGRGGRNQHLALAVAKRIAGQKGLTVLCCGTDGSDGPTIDAGAIVSGETIAQGEALGLVAEDFLQRADAGTYFAALNALVTTGPTGTNVMDLAIAVRQV